MLTLLQVGQTLKLTMKRHQIVDDATEVHVEEAEDADQDEEENVNESTGIAKKVVEEWETVKVHAISHYKGDIERSGATQHYSSETFENLHQKAFFIIENRQAQSPCIYCYHLS